MRAFVYGVYTYTQLAYIRGFGYVCSSAHMHASVDICIQINAHVGLRSYRYDCMHVYGCMYALARVYRYPEVQVDAHNLCMDMAISVHRYAYMYINMSLNMSLYMCMVVCVCLRICM